MGTLEHILERRAGGAVSPATLWPQRCQLNMSPPAISAVVQMPRCHFGCTAGLSSVPAASRHRRAGPDAHPAFGDGAATAIPKGDAARGASLPLTLQGREMCERRGAGCPLPCQHPDNTQCSKGTCSRHS